MLAPPVEHASLQISAINLNNPSPSKKAPLHPAEWLKYFYRKNPLPVRVGGGREGEIILLSTNTLKVCC